MTNTFSPRGRFCGPIMPMSILKRKDLSPGAKLLYALLSNTAAPGCDHCWPSYDWLASKLGSSRRSVQNWMHELEDLQLIRIESRSGKSGTYFFLLSGSLDLLPRQAKTEANFAQVAPNTQANFAQVQPDTQANFAHTQANFAYRSKVINKKYNSSPLPPKPAEPSPQRVREGGIFACACKDKEQDEARLSADSAFNALYALWPVKQAEKSARAVWRKLWFSGVLPAPDSLMAKIHELIQHDRWWQRGNVPTLDRWLQGERWKDQPVPLAEPNRKINTSAPESAPTVSLDPVAGSLALAAMREHSRRETANLLAIKRANNKAGVWS